MDYTLHALFIFFAYIARFVPRRLLLEPLLKEKVGRLDKRSLQPKPRFLLTETHISNYIPTHKSSVSAHKTEHIISHMLPHKQGSFPNS